MGLDYYKYGKNGGRANISKRIYLIWRIKINFENVCEKNGIVQGGYSVEVNENAN